MIKILIDGTNAAQAEFACKLFNCGGIATLPTDFSNREFDVWIDIRKATKALASLEFGQWLADNDLAAHKGSNAAKLVLARRWIARLRAARILAKLIPERVTGQAFKRRLEAKRVPKQGVTPYSMGHANNSEIALDNIGDAAVSVGFAR